jgi:hypothetical protein
VGQLWANASGVGNPLVFIDWRMPNLWRVLSPKEPRRLEQEILAWVKLLHELLARNGYRNA